MAQKDPMDQSKLLEIALNLADENGWTYVTPQKVAKVAKMKASDVARMFPSSWAFMHYALQDLDNRLSCTPIFENTSWRDILFDLIMTRFDLMQKHRRAFQTLQPMLLKSPATLPGFAELFQNSLKIMLTKVKAPHTVFHQASFGMLYFMIERTWRKDETVDLAKTMAVADQHLTNLVKIFSFLPHCSHTSPLKSEDAI